MSIPLYYMKTAFIYNDIFRNSSFGSNHPVLPKRVSNVYDFVKLLNFNKKVDFIKNKKANFKTLLLFHTLDYLKILKKTEKIQSEYQNIMQKNIT